MGVRFRADWTSIEDQDYRVEIHDVDYSGAVNSLEIGMDNFDGFTLDYSGENEGLENTLITSSCVVNCVVEDATFETFISDVAGDDEERFFVVIYKDNKGAWELFWAGVVLQDLVMQEDLHYSYLFQLEATDGIARLEDIKYNAVVNTMETFQEYLINILSALPIAQFWDATDVFLTTIVDWYEDDHFTTSPAYTLDPLTVTRVNNSAFMEENDDTGELEGFSSFDILHQVALRWFAHLILVNGRFYFRQVNRMGASTVDQRDYFKSGTLDAASTANDYGISTFDRQGNYQFKKMYRKVTVTYIYNAAVNLLPNQDLYETSVDIGDLPGGNDETMLFDGRVRITMDVGGTGWQSHHRWVFDLKIKVGSYYLTNKNDILEWTTTSSDRVRLRTTFYHTLQGGYTATFPFGFTTPEIPADGSGEFEFDFIQLEDIDDNVVSPPPGVTSSYSCINFTLTLDFDGETESGQTIFEATNEPSGTLVKASSVLDLGEIYTGDGPYDYSDGALEVFATSSLWELSDGEWTDGGTGTGVNINELLVLEVLAAYKKPRKMYVGTVWADDLTALSILSLDSKKFIFAGGSFNANYNTWDGEWIEVGPDKTYIEISKTEVDDPSRIDKYSRASTGSAIQDLIVETMQRREEVFFKGKDAKVTANYTIPDDGEHVIYADPSGGTFTITLPAYSATHNKPYLIVNTDATTSITIGAATGDYLDSTASGTYTLAADTSITIHNSGISAVGWWFLGKKIRS